MAIIIRCPYCGTHFQIYWEADEETNELVVVCPACKSIVMRAKGFHIEKTKQGR